MDLTYRDAARRKDLDGLRGIAVLLIFFLHYVSRSGVLPLGPLPVVVFLNSFWSGVDIFFVLSGFLIGGVILDHGGAENFFRIFYLRRALRILPMAFLTIGLAYLVLPLVNPTNMHVTGVPPYAYPLFINNYWTASGSTGYLPLEPMWSVAVEEQFYLLAPAFLLLTKPRVRTAALVLIVLLSPLLRASASRFSPWDFTPLRLDGFAVGMLVAIAVRSPRFSAVSRSARRSWLLGATGAVTVALLFSIAPHWPAVQVAWGVSLNSLAAGGVILALQLAPRSWLSRALSTVWLTTVGRFSYALYLLQLPVYIWVATFLGQQLRGWRPASAFAVCIFCAWLSWRFLESPLLRFGRRFEYRDRTGLLAEPVALPTQS